MGPRFQASAETQNGTVLPAFPNPLCMRLQITAQAMTMRSTSTYVECSVTTLPISGIQQIEDISYRDLRCWNDEVVGGSNVGV